MRQAKINIWKRHHVTPQVNLEIGVRFGLSLNQGNRCFMEDTVAHVANAFRSDAGNPGSQRSVEPHEGATGTGTGVGMERDAAAYFGVFDGTVSPNRQGEGKWGGEKRRSLVGICCSGRSLIVGRERRQREGRGCVRGNSSR